MAQDGIHLPTKEFRDNYANIFRKKQKSKKKKHLKKYDYSN